MNPFEPALPAHVTLAPGQSWELVLEQPASAGYLWEVVERPACAAARFEPMPQAARSNTPGPLIVGGPSPVFLRVTAVEPGDGVLLLALRRPWAAVEPSHAFNIGLRVTAACQGFDGR